MRFFIADAFSNEIFGGNPAGVVLIPEGCDFPDDETLRKTAAELRYSETAFIKTASGGKSEYQVRYFTPAAEVDLCGHATIASFYCLAKAGLLTKPHDTATTFISNATAHTKAGDIEITVQYGKSTADDTSEPEFVMMDMAEPRHIASIQDAVELDRLYDIMGSEFDQSLGLFPMIISTGLPDIILPVSNEADLHALKPDLQALTELSKAYNVTGVHAFTIAENQSEQQTDLVCHARNFAPLYEIDEEAATGTASGALTYYLCLNQKIGTKATCRFIQGEAMGRPSEILTTLDAGETCKIRVGGKAAILAEGEINL